MSSNPVHSITHDDKHLSSIDRPVVEHLDHETDEETRRRFEEWKVITANLAGGFTQMPHAVREDKNLSTSAKHVYQQLLYHMRQKDFCWPSQETIAEGTHLSRRTVIRALDQLYKRGYIEVWRRGLGLTNYYFVNPLAMVASTGLSVSQISLQAPEGVAVEEDSPLAFLYNTTFYADDPPFTSVCQNDTSRSDNLAQAVVPDCHTKNTKGNDTHLMDRDSNDSTPSFKEELLGVSEGEEGTGWHHQGPGTEEEPDQPVGETATTAKEVYNVIPVKNGEADIIALVTGIPASHQRELGGSTPAKRRPIPSFIVEKMTDYSRDLGDGEKSLKSNITRATKIYYTMLDCGQDYPLMTEEAREENFRVLLRNAKEISLDLTNIHYKTGNRWNRLPAFFACLENALGMTPEELAYLRSDAPLSYPQS